MKKFYFLMIILTLVIVGHSFYENTFGLKDIKFAVPMIGFFTYLLIKKSKT